MLISAITKIHSNIGFIECDFLNPTIEKLARDKHSELQQRTLEYKRLHKANAKTNRNKFISVLEDCEIDSNLSFLTNYVNSSIKLGAKQYDRKKYEQERENFNKDDLPNLKFAPYQKQESLFSTPSAKSNNFNPLYGNNTDSLNKNDTGDKLRVEGKGKWDSRGFTDVKAETPTNPYAFNVKSIGSDNFSNSNNKDKKTETIVNNNPNNPYASVSNVVDNKNKSTDNNTVLFPKQPEKKKVEVFDPENDKLKSNLFKGIGKPANEPISERTSKVNNKELMRNMTVANKSNQNNANNIGDILGLDNLTTSTNKSEVNQNNIKPTTNLSTDLFEGIFGTSTSNLSTDNNSNNKVNTSNDIFNQNFDTKINLSNTSNNNLNTSKNLFDNLETIKTNTKKPNKQDFVPLNVDTDKFGEYWTECPNEEKEYNWTVNGLIKPEQFFTSISSKGNIFPVQIINNEAIACAKYKGNISLLHATINGNNTLNIMIKCYNASYIDEIAEFVKSIL